MDKETESFIHGAQWAGIVRKAKAVDFWEANGVRSLAYPHNGLWVHLITLHSGHQYSGATWLDAVEAAMKGA